MYIKLIKIEAINDLYRDSENFIIVQSCLDNTSKHVGKFHAQPLEKHTQNRIRLCILN